MPGNLVIFFWSPFPTKRSTKNPRKIRGKFGAKFGAKSGTKIREKFGELSFCNFSDLKVSGLRIWSCLQITAAEVHVSVLEQRSHDPIAERNRCMFPK